MLEPLGRGYVIVPVANDETALRKGDVLLRIGDTPTSGLTTAEIMRKISGIPGAIRKLTIERNHATLSVNAKVVTIY